MIFYRRSENHALSIPFSLVIAELMGRTFHLAVSFLACGMVAAATLSLSAQATRTTADGVYTAAQATRGEKIYADTCAGCHGADLKGSGVNPPLNGPDFDSYWRGKAVGELFEKISVTMPKTAPGSLTPAQSADAVAYVLSMLKAPAGRTELPVKMDDLNAINIQAAN